MNEITSVNSNGDLYPVKIDEEELKSRTDPLSFDVLRKSATESAFSGEYTDTETIGVYKCKACFAELFRSDSKFHSGCGWPSAHPVVHILDMFLLVRGMQYQQIKDGV
jgi:peptide-methionine (R)-S-oxide reductase